MRNLCSYCGQRKMEISRILWKKKKCFGEQRKTDGGDVVPCSLDILVGRCPFLDGVPFWLVLWRIFGGLITTGTALMVCVCLSQLNYIYTLQSCRFGLP